MTENECIEILKNNFPKTCKMVDGRYKGGFDDTECEFGQALLLSISALEEIQQYRTIGTVEECREARKRYTEIKPIKGKALKTIGYYQCSVCRCLLMQYEKFCDNCGQKLDWSE